MNQLIERLRQYEGEDWETTACYNGLRDEAANEIKRLASSTAFAWLIEAPGQNYLGTRNIGYYPDFYWTTDHAKATRFYSQEQADGVLMAVRRLVPELFAFAVNLGDARAVEHGWMGSPA